MKTYNVTLKDSNLLPQEIKNNENYNPTLDFNKTYIISENDIKKYDELCKLFGKKNWSSKEAMIKAYLIDLAMKDGLKADGNFINIKEI